MPDIETTLRNRALAFGQALRAAGSLPADVHHARLDDAVNDAVASAMDLLQGDEAGLDDALAALPIDIIYDLFETADVSAMIWDPSHGVEAFLDILTGTLEPLGIAVDANEVTQTVGIEGVTVPFPANVSAVAPAFAERVLGLARQALAHRGYRLLTLNPAETQPHTIDIALRQGHEAALREFLPGAAVRG